MLKPLMGKHGGALLNDSEVCRVRMSEEAYQSVIESPRFSPQDAQGGQAALHWGVYFEGFHGVCLEQFLSCWVVRVGHHSFPSRTWLHQPWCCRWKVIVRPGPLGLPSIRCRVSSGPRRPRMPPTCPTTRHMRALRV